MGGSSVITVRLLPWLALVLGISSYAWAHLAGPLIEYLKAKFYPLYGAS